MVLPQVRGLARDNPLRHMGAATKKKPHWVERRANCDARRFLKHVLLPELHKSVKKANRVPLRWKAHVRHDETTDEICVYLRRGGILPQENPCVFFGRDGNAITIRQCLAAGVPDAEPVSVRLTWNPEQLACRIELPGKDGPVAVTAKKLVARSLDGLFFGTS